MQLTEEQILQLAPDAASAKAGQQLATTAKWVARHAHEKALWGDCQGSGKNPYRTSIDLGTIAFKCSCPSRKFPCKHGLGLFLLYARNPAAFSKEGSLSPDVEDWLGKRENKAVTKEAKEAKAPDTKGQEKRSEERERKVAAGMEELRIWLKDLVRNGIMGIPQEAHAFHRSITARMVDAQAAGVAGMLRRLADLNYYQEGWQQPFLRRISNLYLLTEAYKRLGTGEGLPEQDIRSLIGWSTPKEVVLQGESISDHWLVLAAYSEADDKLTVDRTWLWGATSRRFALLLNFYAPGQLPQATAPEGSVLEAAVAFYPSRLPLRALIKEQTATKAFAVPQLPPNSFNALEQQLAENLAQLPFQEQMPFLLSPARIVMHKNTWYLCDSASKVLPLLSPEMACWKVLAVTGGEACTAFVLYEASGLRLLSFWFNDSYYSLS